MAGVAGSSLRSTACCAAPFELEDRQRRGRSASGAASGCGAALGPTVEVLEISTGSAPEPAAVALILAAGAWRCSRRGRAGVAYARSGPSAVYLTVGIRQMSTDHRTAHAGPGRRNAHALLLALTSWVFPGRQRPPTPLLDLGRSHQKRSQPQPLSRKPVTRPRQTSARCSSRRSSTLSVRPLAVAVQDGDAGVDRQPGDRLPPRV